MKKKHTYLFIDIGIITLIFFTIFTIPILFGGLSKNDKKIESVREENTVTVNTVDDSHDENINTKKLIDSNIDLNTVDVYMNSIRQVKKIALEEYIIGVVLSEMPATFEDEALMAQSVIARTYVISKKLSPCSETKSKGAEICDTTHCQAYTSIEEKKKAWGNKADEYYGKIKNAVDKTKGFVVAYNGSIIQYPQYFAISSGKTEEAINVFAVDVPYLKSVESPGEEEAPKYKSSKTYTKSNFLNIVSNNIKGANLELATMERSIEILSRNIGDTVKEVKIGNKVITGVEFRKIFGLNSANFSISFESNNVIINCKGYGHGVGMSQWGANYMAQNGTDYKEIIKHYFQGSDVINLEDVYFE